MTNARITNGGGHNPNASDQLAELVPGAPVFAKATAWQARFFEKGQ
jgi:hypothetical protein